MDCLFEAEALAVIGITEAGHIKPDELCFGEEIRKLCEGNVCRNYGASWACPPAVGPVEECRRRCLAYGDAMLFAAAYPLADSFDFEGMKAAHGLFKRVCDRLYFAAPEKTAGFLLLSNEGCSRCESCTYPSAPCRMPDMLFPSLEGFGIYVNKAASSAGIRYINGPDTVTYFGLLLY